MGSIFCGFFISFAVHIYEHSSRNWENIIKNGKTGGNRSHFSNTPDQEHFLQEFLVLQHFF